MKEAFEKVGYLVLPQLLSEEELEVISESVTCLSLDGAGSRNILDQAWCRRLAKHLSAIPSISALLPEGGAVVQCTYFAKSPSTNWLVTPHRDQFIPVKSKVEDSGWSGWSVKEGTHFVRAPVEVLQSLVAIRLHLEENTLKNGPLKVVPKSHLESAEDEATVCCVVEKGGAVAMKPMILHSSSKVLEGARRVLHFVYGPRELPNGIEWQYAV